MFVIPRSEYPRPQFVRSNSWMNLNGLWQFEIDQGCSGRARNLIAQPLSDKILVPFCPESELSLVNNKDFMRCVWYKRSFTLPVDAKDKQVFVHFGAVDYDCEVWVNGISVGTHQGGYASFSFNITKALQEGENWITVCAQDDTRSPLQPSGKQSTRYESYGCYYTRTTGIWQTVWLEWVENAHIENVKLTPDAANHTLHIHAQVANANGCQLLVKTSFQGENTGEAEVTVNGDWAQFSVVLTQTHLWNVGDGKLYDLHFTLSSHGETCDTVESYFGLRSLAFDGKRFLLNGKPVFQRLVLDQGFYPDGIYTAPSDDALRRDIELSMAMGFNGARLHQKVFEQRFLYWADVKGYLCWGEMANWGLDHSDMAALGAFLKEWLQVVQRDYNAPSIIGWCPFNETWDFEGRKQNDEVLRNIYRTTKALDPTRPVIDTSGNFHVETDIFDVHDYEQHTEVFASHYGKGSEMIYDRYTNRQHYEGQPVFVSEYGGIRWSQDQNGWGYGEGPKTEEEFISRYQGLTDALLDNPDHFAFCYTQLTDVEQEQNGLYTYDRKPKFPQEIMHRITARKAAIEITETKEDR